MTAFFAVCAAVFTVCAFIILNFTVLYPVFIKLVGKIRYRKKLPSADGVKRDITIVVLVRGDKPYEALTQLLKIPYTSGATEYILACDPSAPERFMSVREFIVKHPEVSLRFFVYGSNPCGSYITNEILSAIRTPYFICTDLSQQLRDASPDNLMSMFSDEKTAFACGRVLYSDNAGNVSEIISRSVEDMYFSMRETEGRLFSVADSPAMFYAAKTEIFRNCVPEGTPALFIPSYIASRKNKALCAPQATATAEAATANGKNFSCQVKSSITLIKGVFSSKGALNGFKRGFFSVSYFARVVCRSLQWCALTLAAISCFVLLFFSLWFMLPLLLLLIFIAAAVVSVKTGAGGVFAFSAFYFKNVFSQFSAFINIIVARAKKKTYKA